MSPQQFFDGPMRELIERADEVMRAKMVDYANDSDFAQNFKRAADSTGLTPAQVWTVFADKHWGAITSYARTGYAESEGIRERLVDLINYCCLLYGLIKAGLITEKVL